MFMGAFRKTIGLFLIALGARLSTNNYPPFMGLDCDSSNSNSYTWNMLAMLLKEV
ncbi:MAG: hypothetical protein RSB67_01890 [Clostridia bacterium]